MGSELPGSNSWPVLNTGTTSPEFDILDAIKSDYNGVQDTSIFLVPSNSKSPDTDHMGDLPEEINSSRS